MPRDINRCPSHPGELLRMDVFPARGMDAPEIAQALGISCQSLDELLAARNPVTPDLAERLSQLLGNGPGLWIRMQAAHDNWWARRNNAS